MFKVGDRVCMRSALVPMNGDPPPLLFGTVEQWPRGGPGGQIVRWDDWPCMTALPNPHVRPLVELD